VKGGCNGHKKTRQKRGTADTFTILESKKTGIARGFEVMVYQFEEGGSRKKNQWDGGKKKKIRWGGGTIKHDCS